MSCLHILEINPVLVISLANIFPYFVGCIFVLLTVSFMVQKLLSSMRYHLFFVLFCFVFSLFSLLSQWKSLNSVQLFPTLWNVAPLGSSVHDILHKKLLEWIAFPFSRGSSQPGDQTWVSRIADRSFTTWATRKTHYCQRLIRKDLAAFYVKESKSVPSMFSPKSFIVSAFTFKFLTHFKYIFLYSIRWYFNFILFILQLYQIHW